MTAKLQPPPKGSFVRLSDVHMPIPDNFTDYQLCGNLREQDERQQWAASVGSASGPESVGVASPLNIGPLHPTARCSRQMMNTPLAMITAAPTKVRASGISVQKIQPRSVAHMMAV